MNGFISSPFPPTSARALYQGTTLVVPHTSPQRWALAPVPISSTFCSLGAYPDFLPRGAGQDRVCAFPQRKAHDVCQRHQHPQEIRGSVVERSAVVRLLRLWIELIREGVRLLWRSRSR